MTKLTCLRKIFTLHISLSSTSLCFNLNTYIIFTHSGQFQKFLFLLIVYVFLLNFSTCNTKNLTLSKYFTKIWENFAYFCPYFLHTCCLAVKYILHSYIFSVIITMILTLVLMVFIGLLGWNWKKILFLEKLDNNVLSGAWSTSLIMM